ncbi:hypothetical protein Fcan01_28611 [Folsomia candida]|uniref:Uncharacterized protein n=1 Tax=Folsomia candida TaxID=158441 RepID=A0A226CVU0_FOLCA|nr:hypothetical protein Fcan01_28611 [Folsomia candida]
MCDDLYFMKPYPFPGINSYNIFLVWFQWCGDAESFFDHFGDTAPYSPSADSSSSSSDCSSSPDAPSPPRLTTSSVDLRLHAKYLLQQTTTKQAIPTPPSSSSTSTTTSSTKPSSGGVGKDFLAVALSFHAAQQEEKASKQQQLNNNNNNALTLNKNAAPHLSPNRQLPPLKKISINRPCPPRRRDWIVALPIPRQNR